MNEVKRSEIMAIFSGPCIRYDALFSKHQGTTYSFEQCFMNWR
jgi:hypothetical protein